MNDRNDDIAPDQVLSVDEGAEIKSRIAARSSRAGVDAGVVAAKQWRWMGNYGDPIQAAAVANSSPPCVAGEVMFSINGNLIPAWMYY